MNRFTFYFVIVLSVLFALLNVAEYGIYCSWQSTMDQQRDYQLRLASAQRRNTVIEGLLRRLVIDSQTDPALGDLLKKHNIKVTFTTAGQAGAAMSSGNPPPESPASSELATPPEPTPAPSHP